jgi:preprotein translocase subunit SecE
METQNQKWVNVSFLSVAVLLAYMLFAAVLKLSGVFDLEAKVKNFELIVRLGSIGIGAAVFFGLYKWHAANQFMNEVVDELVQVTWPARKETINSTWVVIIFVLVMSGVLSVIDWVWTSFIQWILK